MATTNYWGAWGFRVEEVWGLGGLGPGRFRCAGFSV